MDKLVLQGAVLGIEPRTSRTRSENHATRPNSHVLLHSASVYEFWCIHPLGSAQAHLRHSFDTLPCPSSSIVNGDAWHGHGGFQFLCARKRTVGEGTDMLYKMVPRGLEPRTLRLLAVRSNQLSYETLPV